MEHIRNQSPNSPGPLPIVVVLANLVPAFGVLFLGWDSFAVVFLYWVENAIIGLFNVLRMALAGAGSQPESRGGLVVGKLLLIPFFVVHYGIFMMVHGVFIFALLAGPLAGGAGGIQPLSTVHSLGVGFAVAILSLFAEHAYAFYRDWIEAKLKDTNPLLQMFKPYGRIILIHIVILVGAFLVLALKLPAMMAVLLIVIKTGFELVRRPTSQLGQFLDRPS